jgi:hypothetical protein
MQPGGVLPENMWGKTRTAEGDSRYRPVRLQVHVSNLPQNRTDQKPGTKAKATLAFKIADLFWYHHLVVMPAYLNSASRFSS